MIDRFFDQLAAGASSHFVAVSVILAALLALLLLFRNADLRALRRSRSANDAADLRAALNELASAAHELQLTGRRADGQLLAAEPGTVASLRRTASALSRVSEDMKTRVPFIRSDRDRSALEALRHREST